ncbi:MAG: ABC transporter permease subunit [Candidatus Sericytochromatia bacterium]
MRAPWLVVAGREARLSARLLILLVIGLVLVAYLMASAFPAFKERMLSAGAKAPAFVRRMLEARAGGIKVESFLALVYAHPVVLALATVWPVSRATQAIAGEIERGGLAWKLSYPVSRGAYVAAKAAVLILGTGILAAALALGFLGSLRWLGIPTAGPVPYAWAALAGFLLYTAIGMLTLWASAASRRAGPVAMAGGGLTLASYLLFYVADIWEALKPYQWLSLFRYADQGALLTGATPVWTDLAVLVGVAVVGFVGAIVTFSRRDLSI